MEHTLRIIQNFNQITLLLPSLIDHLPDRMSGNDFQIESSKIKDEFKPLDEILVYFQKDHKLSNEILMEVNDINFDKILFTNSFLSIRKYIDQLPLPRNSYKINNRFLHLEDYIQPESSNKFRARIEYYMKYYQCSHIVAYEMAYHQYKRELNSEEFLDNTYVSRESLNDAIIGYFLTIFRICEDWYFRNGAFINYEPKLFNDECPIIKKYTLTEIEHIYKFLKEHEFIHPSTELVDFTKFMQNSKNNNYKLIWTDIQDNKESNKMSLLLFIKKIVASYKSTEYLYNFIHESFVLTTPNTSDYKSIEISSLPFSNTRLNNEKINKKSRYYLIEKILEE